MQIPGGRASARALTFRRNRARGDARPPGRRGGARGSWWWALAALVALATPLEAQTLINVDFGVGTASLKTGMAAAGMGTNDYWNLYRHYQPKFTPGMALVADGKLDKLKLADGTESGVSVAVNNAPGRLGQLQRRPDVRHLHLRPERQQHHRHRQRPGAGAIPFLLLRPRRRRM